MKKLVCLLSLVLTLGLIGCSSKHEVKNVPVTDIKAAINNEELLSIQPVSDIDAKDFYAFENVKDSIKEGFVLQAMINVKLQDVFVFKTNNVEKVKQAIEEYTSNNLKMFADGYGGNDNATSVADSVLESVGDYVYFIAAPNVKNIEAKILELIK